MTLGLELEPGDDATCCWTAWSRSFDAVPVFVRAPSLAGALGSRGCGQIDSPI